MNFNSDEYERGLTGDVRVGYITAYSNLPPSASTLRALNEAKAALKSTGATLVPIQLSPELEWKCFEIFFGNLGTSIKHVMETLNAANNEKLHPFYNQFNTILNIPSFLKKIVIKLLEVKGEVRLVRLLGQLEKQTAEDIHEICVKRSQVREEFTKIMTDNKLDAILSPVSAHSATKIENVQKLGSLSYYNFLANVCDSPSGVLPVTHVKKGEDRVGYEDGINDSITQVMRKDVKGTEGMPIGLQIMGEQFKDEKTLGVLVRLEEALGFKTDPNLA